MLSGSMNLFLFCSMKTVIDLDNWNRKEHFNFFNSFEEPYFGLTFELDVTEAKAYSKKNGLPFFLVYHFLSTKVLNQIDALRLRIEGEQVVCYDVIHATTTIMREDKTFSFSFIPFHDDLGRFIEDGLAEIERIQSTSGIGMSGHAARLDIIHYSTLPWVPFKGLTHARSFSFKDSAPKISFGKLIQEGDTWKMPVSIFSHHALVDGYDIGLYYDSFQEILTNLE